MRKIARHLERADVMLRVNPDVAKQLKAQGYRFVGPTSVYAFMQNVGVVNDHVHGCFRATDYRASAR